MQHALDSKKTIAAGVAVAAVAVTGVGVGLGGADAQAPTHTLRFVSSTTADHQYTDNVSSDSGTDKQGKKVIGYDVTTGVYHSKTTTITGDLAVSLRGGQIYGTYSVDTTTGALTGKVTGGAGVYRGISGKISGASLNPVDTRVVITYRT